MGEGGGGAEGAGPDLFRRGGGGDAPGELRSGASVDGVRRGGFDRRGGGRGGDAPGEPRAGDGGGGDRVRGGAVRGSRDATQRDDRLLRGLSDRDALRGGRDRRAGEEAGRSLA